jgi:hypothetical protein
MLASSCSHAHFCISIFPPISIAETTSIFLDSDIGRKMPYWVARYPMALDCPHKDIHRLYEIDSEPPNTFDRGIMYPGAQITQSTKQKKQPRPRRPGPRGPAGRSRREARAGARGAPAAALLLLSAAVGCCGSLRAVGCGLWAVGCGLWAVGCGLRAAGCGLRAVGLGLLGARSSELRAQARAWLAGWWLARWQAGGWGGGGFHGPPVLETRTRRSSPGSWVFGSSRYPRA